MIRRRVRKDDAEEEKCKSVAELLLKGKTGASLENEIKDKIERGPGSSSGSSKRDKWVDIHNLGAIAPIDRILDQVRMEVAVRSSYRKAL